ncbi:MAG: iron-sulfur cluster assembly scaffold protein [Deltaproteobacteria bacterium]|nr:iron-sulfur cluster assembly scaffold protein [Deltaproteobacteria bacterium]
MSQEKEALSSDPESIREMLLGSGYGKRAIAYYLEKANMGTLRDPDQVSEMTGVCGDTMKIYLKVDQGRITDAKMQVLGCPGAVASAMAAVDLVRGKTLEEAMGLKDRDVFRVLEEIPDQKQHCIRLTVKTLQKAIEEYKGNNGNSSKGG